MDIYGILVLGHILGTILGAGGATLAEIQIIRALKDGAVDVSERSLLHSDYAVIRIGMALIIFSGIVLVWWNFSEGNNWVMTSSKLLFKYSLMLFIIVNAVLISKRLIPLWLGSAISFTSWWMATILGFWKKIDYTFFQLFFYYIIIVFVVAGISTLIKRYYYSV